MDMIFCSRKMRTELTGWELRISEELSKIDGLPSIDKHEMHPAVKDMNNIVSDIKERIEIIKSRYLWEWFSFDNLDDDSFYHVGWFF